MSCGRLASFGLYASAFLVCSLVFAQSYEHVNSQPETDFSKYHTYRWVTIRGSETPSQQLGTAIKQAVDTRMSAKGLTLVENGPADLYVAYHVSIRHDNQWDTYDTGVGPRWGDLEDREYHPPTISRGTLVLDVYDSGQKQLVWRGTATRVLDPNSSQETRQKNLDKAIRKLMEKFPPKPK